MVRLPRPAASTATGTTAPCDWDTYVLRSAADRRAERFGIDPQRLAIGGISMGFFGAFDIALYHPGRFCAVGSHSPALWFDRSKRRPAPSKTPADFEAQRRRRRGRRTDPDAFCDAHLWIDYGDRRRLPRLRRRLRRSASTPVKPTSAPIQAGRTRRRLLEPPLVSTTSASTSGPRQLLNPASAEEKSSASGRTISATTSATTAADGGNSAEVARRWLLINSLATELLDIGWGWWHAWIHYNYLVDELLKKGTQPP